MLLLAYGTRPEYIKLKSLIHEFDLCNFPYKTLFTGQHKDLVKELKPDYQSVIIDGENRLDSIVVSLLDSFDNVLAHFPEITHVLVQGDTTSAFAVALSAFHHGIKVIHLEAGLRTYDRENPYPEEINRRLISQIADIHLCPTKEAQQNLYNEKNYGESYVVGNTVIDNLLPYKDKCEYQNKILVTLHRRENHKIMNKWFVEVDRLAEQYGDYEFILPIHPNPAVKKWAYLLPHVKVVDPLSYEDMLELLIKCRIVITDSGGLQEESCFFNKKCLTCRIVTERPEAVGFSTFMVDSPDELCGMFAYHEEHPEINVECPFGDGHAAEKIIEIFMEMGI
jgi:UDP-N-acetylglucosamine 2-epimerase (non-hydrolysing)